MQWPNNSSFKSIKAKWSTLVEWQQMRSSPWILGKVSLFACGSTVQPRFSNTGASWRHDFARGKGKSCFPGRHTALEWHKVLSMVVSTVSHLCRNLNWNLYQPWKHKSMKPMMQRFVTLHDFWPQPQFWQVLLYSLSISCILVCRHSICHTMLHIFSSRTLDETTTKSEIWVVNLLSGMARWVATLQCSTISPAPGSWMLWFLGWRRSVTPKCMPQIVIHSL